MGLGRSRVLREGAIAPAEHLVSGLKLRNVLPDRFDDPGDIHAADGHVRSPKPESQAHEIREARHQVPITLVDAGCKDADEHIVRANRWSVDLPELQDVGGAVPVLDNRLHLVTYLTYNVNVWCKLDIRCKYVKRQESAGS